MTYEHLALKILAVACEDRKKYFSREADPPYLGKVNLWSLQQGNRPFYHGEGELLAFILNTEWVFLLCLVGGISYNDYLIRWGLPQIDPLTSEEHMV
tara:strand:+ start:9289 stop:9579 length:291 start_codon:yes stop_codon:yes gene_type:complete